MAIFKELVLRRKKKLLNLVFVAAETGIMKRDYENMLQFEKEIFDRLIKAFEEGDRFMAFPVKEGVLFKKIKMPEVKVEFEKLSKEIEEQFKKNKISKNDISRAVKWARKK